MVYLGEITKIPKVIDTTPTSIEFVNQTTKQVTTITDLAVKDKVTYFEISFLLEGFSVGQYNYTLKANDAIVGKGIAQYGDFTRTNTEYEQQVTIKSYGEGV